MSLDESEPRPLKVNRKAIAYLSLYQDQAVSRKVLVDDLWPETETSVSQNRLRVVLNQLRTTFGSALMENDEGVRLHPFEVEVDISTLQDRARHASDEISPDSELEELVSLLDDLKNPILPGYADAWAMQAQLEWAAFVVRIALRTTHLAMERRHLALVTRAARLGLAHEPFNSQLWTHLLRATGPGRERDEVLDEFRAARRNYRAEEGLEFPDDLIELANDIALSKNRLTESLALFDDAQREFGGQLLERIVETLPDTALELLAVPETLDVSVRFIRQTSDILDMVLPRTSRRDEVFVRAIARAMGLKAMRDDWDGVLDLYTKLEGVPVPAMVKPIVLNSLGLAKANIRDWDGAMEAADESIMLYQQAGEPQKVATSLCNKASYTYLQGDFTKGEAIFEEAAAILRQFDPQQVAFPRVVLMLNRSLVPLMQGHFSVAWHQQEECYALCLANEIHHAQPVICPSLGMLRIEAGEIGEAVSLIHTGLRAAFLMGATRFQQIGLEYGAGALGMLGDVDRALGILDWANEWRIQTRHVRAPAEELLISKIIERFPSQGEKVQIPEKTPHVAVARYLIRELRAAEKERAV